MGANDQIELYLRVDLWYAKLVPSVCLYYKLSSEVTGRVKKLTRTNLRNDFGGTAFEKNLFAFLARYHPCKKDQKSGVYTILEAFVPHGLIE